MKGFRKQFPVLSRYLYADTAASGLLYDDLLEWRQGHDLDFLIGGSVMKMQSLQLLEDTRTSVARFFKCQPAEVALSPNFSLGLNLLLEGLDPSRGVLLLKEDYPSVNWPFMSRGFPLHYALADSRLEENILCQLEKNKISVLALSLVQWVNGLAVNMAFLKELKKTYPELLIIADGTQYCGAFEMNFADSGIDILGCSGYKWLLSGYGNAFVICREGSAKHFNLKSTGFNAAQGRVEDRDRIRFPRQLEPGHLDSLNFGSLKFSLDWLRQTGIQELQAHNALLSSQAAMGLAELGLLDEKLLARPAQSSIFNIRGDQALFTILKEAGVICSRRGEGIRLSFHFYNTESELDMILDILKKALAS